MSTTTTPTVPASPSQAAGESWPERLRRWRTSLMAGAALTVFMIAVVLLRPTTSTVDLAIDNPEPSGAQALAELLRARDIEVWSSRTVQDALDQAGPGTTVVLIQPRQLTREQGQQLAASGADVTVVGALYVDLSGLTDARLRTRGTGVPASATLQAGCADPDAEAAGTLAGTRASVEVDGAGGAVGCFPVEGHSNLFAYATAPMSGGGTLRVLADSSVVTNKRLTTAGNAALSMRTIGHRSSIIWLDPSNVSAMSVLETVSLPPWLPLLAVHAVAVTAFLALARGRRLGRLAAEDLPVVVRSTETTTGRGRLYRQARDHEQAARSLRAGTARRLGRRLGLPPSSSPEALIDAVATATGIRASAITEALYGPAPSNAQSLTELAAQLDRLESEVSSA